MLFKVFKNTVLLFVLVLMSCNLKVKSDVGNLNASKQLNDQSQSIETPIIVGANQTTSYLHLLKNKRVGLVANQTSVIFKDVKQSSNKQEYTHLIDSLLKHNIHIEKVFAPEHGFRGMADAGETVKDGIDTATGIPVISLYGKNKKPSIEHLANLEVMVFDIQDVGARFYTYISSLHYVMEACAEQQIPLILLDRPNPNGHYIDGPILELEHSSFVGMHPVPVVHGMTIGEYAQMINGEGWLRNSVKCEITVIPVKNYSHHMFYSLPIKPSPNLPNDTSINLYPSLCFFEGTNVSVGRGTNQQFQIIGTPFFKPEESSLEFTPKPNLGAKNPKHEGKVCYGFNLSNHERLDYLNLSWLINLYKQHETKNSTSSFFNSFFTQLAGTEKLQEQIENNDSEATIRASWAPDLTTFKAIREPYLLY